MILTQIFTHGFYDPDEIEVRIYDSNNQQVLYEKLEFVLLI